MKAIYIADKAIMKALEILCIALSLAMAVVVALQITMRLYVQPLLWSEESSRIMMVWLVFLGAAYLFNQKSNGHIVVDVVHQVVPARVTRILMVFVNVIVFAILIITTIYGFKLAVNSVDIKSTALRIPFVYIYAAIPVSTALMLFFSLRRLAEWVFRIVTGEAGEKPRG